MTNDSNFRSDFKEAMGFDWRPWRWASKGLGIVVLIMIVGGLLSAAVWGIGVATSNTRGRGEAVKIKNDATNRVQAQAQFHVKFDAIKALDQKLTDAQVNLDAFNKAHPGMGNATPYDPTAEEQANLQRDLTGAQQQCRNAVADYNASTETFTLRDFRDSDLPFKIDGSDPLFTGHTTHGAAKFSDFDCTVTPDELTK